MLPTRLRKNAAVRDLIRETELSMRDVVYPLFVVDGENIKREIPSMKRQYHLSLDMLPKELDCLLYTSYSSSCPRTSGEWERSKTI